MDENKIFDLLEKIYVEVQSTKDDVSTLKSDVSTLKGDVNTLKSDVSTLKGDVRKIGIKIDEEIIPIQKALLDGYKQNAEQIAIMDEKIDKLQIDVNCLTAKTAYNDSRIIEISRDFKKAK